MVSKGIPASKQLEQKKEGYQCVRELRIVQGDAQNTESEGGKAGQITRVLNARPNI